MTPPAVVEEVDEDFGNTTSYGERSPQHTVPIVTPVPSADLSPNPDILPALEYEICALAACICDCVVNGRINELLKLGSDLHSAVTTMANHFPAYSLSERPAVVVELLLERVVALGTD
jgi:hypothetical protein